MFLYEKITGTKAQSMEFIQGITERVLRDAVASSEADKARQGALMYKGVIAIPIPGDIPVQRVSIPLAEVPDGFDYQQIHDNTAVGYCAAIQMDVNDLDPRIAQRAGIGTGAQALVLNEKSRGKGLAGWREDWTMEIHRLAAGTATTFAWSEDSTDDELKQEQLAMARQNRLKLMMEGQLISADQAKNMSVDAGDMPREYLAKDETADLTVESEENADQGTPQETAVVEEPIREQVAETAKAIYKAMKGDADEHHK